MQRGYFNLKDDIRFHEMHYDDASSFMVLATHLVFISLIRKKSKKSTSASKFLLPQALTMIIINNKQRDALLQALSRLIAHQ